MNLNNNKLNGIVPNTDISWRFPNMTAMDLSGNTITGNFNLSARLPNLTNLNMSNNNLAKFVRLFHDLFLIYDMGNIRTLY